MPSKPAPTSAPEQPASDLVTVTQLAEQLGVTARAIRFYETKGLLTPARLGGVRAYTRREQARMKLILRGKRLGFSLREIKEFLDLYDADTTHSEQMRRLVKAVRVRIDTLEEQRTALTQTLRELVEIEQQALERLQAPPGKTTTAASARA